MTVSDVEPADPGTGRPPLPPGRFVHLEGRGPLLVREIAGPVDAVAPPLLLIHGAAVTAALNWSTVYDALARRTRVVSFDHRGHGQSLRTWRRYRLSDTADDAVALADALGIERLVPVGYSMGGAVAQIIARRYPDRVAGLVLCATWSRFSRTRRAAWMVRRIGTAGRVARALPPRWQERAYLAAARRLSSIDGRPQWIVDEALSGDVAMMLEAIGDIGRFDSRRWIGELEVRTGLIVFTDDEVVAPARQWDLAHALPRADVRELPLRHDGCLTHRYEFVPVFAEVVDGVLDAAARHVRAGEVDARGLTHEG